MTVKLLTSTNLLLCFLISLSIGCSAEQDSTLGTVAGQVTLNGDAFSDCKVAIYDSVSLKTRGAQVQPDGTYMIKEVTPGDYKVMVLPPPLEDDAEVAKIPIPKKLRSRDTTDLTVTVKANESAELNVEL